ncbi:hypothetical protein MADA3029_1220053 [Vibrio nigripulchritudo MADA3029]|uniref:CHAT domain-containing protein n=2 Tax=Vibrio nigripulchritudo TaxID=28173 RepID=A0AAV2VSL4_9VIBR|nr:hypothetical protein VIBNIMADA3020_800053 [Vibrio nigripulchritudo MADA3020]CCN55293.1 hypothetical protein VIBNIMADA3021_740012 [Vibrio nigripulchritudo MADA3021]CCN58000.1 hypothetical protein MADA3029_1220053 [Vibrio nigripulchritudo MADA3029]CCO47726.1 hypothetical protein VIBNISOn1_340041 [Vibrio nigripulchritudo SOn1]
MYNKIRLFIIECVDPMDLLNERSEAEALEQVCKIFGHKVAKFIAYSEKDLIKYCNYISSIDSSHGPRGEELMPLCIHISAHGNKKGIEFGSDFLRWREVFEAMKPIFTDMNDYDGEVFVSLSSCEAGSQGLDRLIAKEWEHTGKIDPPRYIFTTSDDGGVRWDHAVVSWTVFYHRIANIQIIKKDQVQDVIDDIKQCIDTHISYFRWDSTKSEYLYYSPDDDCSYY